MDTDVINIELAVPPDRQSVRISMTTRAAGSDPGSSSKQILQETTVASLDHAISLIRAGVDAATIASSR
jgi:hypothetical protein